MVAAALALLCVACSAARLPFDVQGLPRELEEHVPKWMASNRRHKGSDFTKMPAYMHCKFIVPPAETDGFIKAWMKMSKDAYKDEKGLALLDLSKTMTDNLMFVGYGEWDTVEDYFQHYMQAFGDLRDYMADHDIKFELTCLENPMEGKEKHQVSAMRAEFKDQKHAHFLIKYYVPPSMHQDWLDMFEDVQDKVMDERGCRMYSVRKAHDSNTHFMVFGSWDSLEDFKDHYASEHVRKLRDFNDDNNITWFLYPLYKITKEGKSA